MNRKVALITGASRGIGKACAIKFASNNFDVIINYNNSVNEAENLKKYILEKYDVSVLCIKADLSNEDEIKNMVNTIVNEFSTIDVLINNAGIAIDSLVEDKTKENFMKTLDVNLIGPFLLTRELSKHINDNGSIVNISSTNGIDTYYPYSLDYDASKAGLISLTNNLSQIYAPIRVNAVAPGWVMTDMNKELDEEYVKEESSKILLDRFAEPEEIANVVYFLASEEASYINNTVQTYTAPVSGKYLFHQGPTIPAWVKRKVLSFNTAWEAMEKSGKCSSSSWCIYSALSVSFLPNL